MTFSDYTDFQDCVSKNGDKDNPQAYCASMHKQSTGKWPTENAEQITASAVALQYSETLAPDIPIDFTERRQVSGVEVFRSGKHTDSQGQERDWTSEELNSMISSFVKKIPEAVPIKLGHSSNDHTAKVAKELGVTSSILTGENGKGAVALGHITKLARSNGTLIANMDVPDKIATLIENGMITGVSSEIIGDYKGNGPVLSGVALLGAERPAVKGLGGFENVTILDDGSKPDYVYARDIITYEPDTKLIEQADSLYAFESGPESIYEVPVSEERTDPSGNVLDRTVTVKHVRASTISEARGVVLRSIEAFASTLGRIIGAGLGQITVMLASESVRRWLVGEPSLVHQARASKSARDRTILSTEQAYTQYSDKLFMFQFQLNAEDRKVLDLLESELGRPATLQDVINATYIFDHDYRQSKRLMDFMLGVDPYEILKTHEDKLIEAFRRQYDHQNLSMYSDQLYAYGVVETGFLILGTYSIGKLLWNIILRQMDGKEQKLQAWAASRPEVDSLVRDNLPGESQILSAAIADVLSPTTGGAIIKALL